MKINLSLDSVELDKSNKPGLMSYEARLKTPKKNWNSEKVK